MVMDFNIKENKVYGHASNFTWVKIRKLSQWRHMRVVASQFNGISTVCSKSCWAWHQIKHRSFALQTPWKLKRRIHRPQRDCNAESVSISWRHNVVMEEVPNTCIESITFWQYLQEFRRDYLFQICAWLIACCEPVVVPTVFYTLILKTPVWWKPRFYIHG